MEIQEAKLRLKIYRPGTGDDSDTFFEEALQMVKQSPELAKWWEAEMANDERVRKMVGMEQVPDGLRESLIESRLETKPREKSKARSFSQWLALAAALAVLLGLALVLKPGATNRATGPDFLKQFAALGESGFIWLAKKSLDPADLQSWLASKGAPSKFAIPAGLSALPGKGCQTYSFHGAKVSLICFKMSDQRIVHLFVIDQKNLLNPPGPVPQVVREGTHLAATWSSGGHTFLMVGVDEETLQLLIG